MCKEIPLATTPQPFRDNGLSEDEKLQQIEQRFAEIMQILGLDLNDDSLMDTPRRIAKMYVKEIFSGLNPKNFPKMTTIANTMGIDEMVLIRDIKVMSLCEHHFAPIHGRAAVAYIPNKKIIGLSKINRVVDYFSRRPQVQERLTKQIADCLSSVLETENVAVFIDARHYCVISRGIEDQNSSTITSDLRGVFRSSQPARHEFLSKV